MMKPQQVFTLAMTRAGLCAAITLGLMNTNALAHDDHPSRTLTPGEAPAGGGHSLAEQATNPIANLVQFQLQNQYNWDNHDSSGYSNTFVIQPVMPVKLSSKAVPLLITRTTIPYVSTADLGAPEHRMHGLGDTTALGLFVILHFERALLYNS